MQPRSDSQQCPAAANNSKAVSLTDSKKVTLQQPFRSQTILLKTLMLGQHSSFCIQCSLCNYDFLTHC